MIRKSSTYLSFIRCLQFGSNLSPMNGNRRNFVTFRNYQNKCGDPFQCFSIYLSHTEPPLNKSVRHYCKIETNCWNCDHKIDVLTFTCQNCKALQRPDPKMTYFQLLDLPEAFDINTDDISTRYKKLQMMFHPDRFVNKSKEEVDISDEYSRLVNKAYSTLKNDLHRGLYILNLRGISTDDDSVKMDQAFLMDILEKNEEVENIKDEKSLIKMSEINNKEITKYILNASDAFKANDLEKAREVLMKMKYFVNIENEIKKKKSEMGVVS
ncbi:UNVERIFIED_CONTAM: hypothetical protein PYX00_000608 [Menopon gallinae]|uniref:J domain-containing protein n=1 Tax=Menopon gallinae TaxID=328185 RepID=A0AAW2IAN7_9NEOP